MFSVVKITCEFCSEGILAAKNNSFNISDEYYIECSECNKKNYFTKNHGFLEFGVPASALKIETVKN